MSARFRTWLILGSRASYPGILDKCPAVSPIDATVVEDLYGVTIRKRERHFSFDCDIYREWSTKGDIWLEEDAHPDEGDGVWEGKQDLFSSFLTG